MNKPKISFELKKIMFYTTRKLTKCFQSQEKKKRLNNDK